jgi:hypothetical protein
VGERGEDRRGDAASDAGEKRIAEQDRLGSVRRLAEAEEPLDERRSEADKETGEQRDDHGRLAA